MNSIIGYFILGISLAAPVGPVNAAQLNTGIRNGFFHALIFGFGALTADILYMIAVYLGVGQLLTSSFMKTLLWSFGAFVLIYTGIEALISMKKLTIKMTKGKRTRLRQSAISGFLMSLMNPLTILFWLGIYGSVLAGTADNVSNTKLLVFSLSMIMGILTWDFTMSILSSGAKKYLSANLLKGITLVTSLSMILFGLYFGLKALELMF
ncbi:LysE family transporter [Chungangia koreensis]|uniref:LysE family transporter n=1 Tax=Chungangia koreensis TaxID=752657 RepID=A0ABV8X324_9LACT